jgi:putative ABC transport system ATP-binding protein
MSLYQEPEQSAALSFGALEFRDVFKIYRSGPVETVALRGFDLRVELGEFVAVRGPSGSGKSTALLIAAGLEEASAGDVRASGCSLTRLSEDEFARYRATETATVFQNGNLLAGLSAIENVELSLRLAGGARGAGALEALVDFHLEDRLHHRPAALSGGEQQRVAIAAAAARRAPLVLADEPTAELDEASELIVLDALRRLCSTYGSTVLVVTHSPRVARASDRVVEVRDGRVR